MAVSRYEAIPAERKKAAHTRIYVIVETFLRSPPNDSVNVDVSSKLLESLSYLIITKRC